MRARVEHPFRTAENRPMQPGGAVSAAKARKTLQIRGFLAFALNHMTCCRLRYDALISLAQQAECVGVEFRNDLPKPLFDGDSPVQVRDTTLLAGVKILVLAEVKMFNDWTDSGHRKANDLMLTAKAVGASAVSLIPRNDGIGCANGERQANLRNAL